MHHFELSVGSIAERQVLYLPILQNSSQIFKNLLFILSLVQSPPIGAEAQNLDTLLSSKMTLTLGSKLPRRLLQLRLARPAACVLASSSPLVDDLFFRRVVSCSFMQPHFCRQSRESVERTWGVPSSSREKQTHCVAGMAGTWVKAWGLRGGDN